MYLTNIEIIQLKKDLMSTTASNSKGNNIGNNSQNTIGINSAKISDIVSKEIRKRKNGEIGVKFEENIRKTLELEYNWKVADIPRHFFYRQIIYKGKSYYITPFLQIDATTFIIKMNNENYSCQFVLKEGEKIVLEIAENNNAIQKIYDGKTFVVYPPKEYEVDGLYQDFNYDELGFDADEVKILFKNINASQYEYCIIEIKLNSNKIEELIQQLKADKIIIDKMVKNNAVYIGFVNLTKNDFNALTIYDYSVICNDMPCIIFGINNGTFCERNIMDTIDWKLITDFFVFKDEFNTFRNEFNTFRNEFNTFRNEFNSSKDELKKELKEFIHNEFINNRSCS